MQKHLYLIRGTSGSGKTTFAKKLIETFNECFWYNIEHFEADQYFMDSEGNYKFNPQKLSEAHRICFENTERCLKDDKTDVVIVSNTFIKLWEIKPYIELAEKFENVDLKIFRTLAQYENTHGVPLEKIEKQKRNMEDIDGEIFI